MQRTRLVVSCVLCSIASWGWAEEITERSSRLTESIKLLASDQYGGRGVGSDGIEMAADHIASQFRELGLRMDTFDGGPYQKFSIQADTKMGSEDNNRLVLFGPESEDDVWDDPQDADEEKGRALNLGENFNSLAIGDTGSYEGSIVFVGYGITAEEYEYDDYANVDVEGRAVLMIRKEPQQQDKDSVFAGRRSSRYATFQSKVKNAKEHGAAAVIIVNDFVELEKNRQNAQEDLVKAIDRGTMLSDKLEGMDDLTEKQTSRYLNDIQKIAKEMQESADKLADEDFDPLLGFQQAGTRGREEIPVFFAHREAIDPMVVSALGKSLQELEAEIDEDLQPQSAPLAGWSIQAAAEVIAEETEVKNVVGVLEGEGSLADETIVVGAHYDHLGMGGPGSLAPWTTDIHNGADDNASGTASLMEIARHFATKSTGPRRRMVFMAFTGEERGLLGSAHYCRNPRFPLEDTVAMINLDMVGRLEDNELTIYGTGTATEFDDLIEGLNEDYGFELKKIKRGYGPSDHASFYAKDIPVLFFFTGLHNDYHRPSDDWDKINYDGMSQIVNMAIESIEAIDAADERPTFVKSNRLTDLFSGRRGGRRRGEEREDDGDSKEGSDPERATDDDSTADNTADGDASTAVEEMDQQEPDAEQEPDGDAAGRPFLGVMPQAEQNPDVEGFLVADVLKDSPADDAGIRADDVIVKLNDQAVTGIDKLRELIGAERTGSVVKLSIKRGDETIELDVKLGTFQ